MKEANLTRGGARRDPCSLGAAGLRDTRNCLSWVDVRLAAARGGGLVGMVRSGENAVIYQGKGVSIRSIPAFHALDGPCPPIRSFDTCPFRLLPSVF